MERLAACCGDGVGWFSPYRYRISVHQLGVVLENNFAEHPAVVFKVISIIPTKTLAGQLPRRERWILLLLDGKRSIVDLAHLTQRSELDVAYTLTKFLQLGYIEPVAGHPSH